MSRAIRKLYDGAVYHIINRGHNRQILFKEGKDYMKFKEILAHYKKRYDFRLYNYCMMTNHFHLLIRINKALDLPHIMQSISQAYAKHHKRKYHNVGYLFQGRYKSFLIEKDEYLLECARYIERNPLRAHIVTSLAKYPWSSYIFYASDRKDGIINANLLYNTFGNTPKERISNYKRYVETPRPYEMILDEVVRKMKP